jgi:hypothetical protein
MEERRGDVVARRSPRSTCSQRRASYGTSSPKPSSVAPIESSTQRARRSTAPGSRSALRDDAREVDERRLRIVDGEDRVDVRRALRAGRSPGAA